ncbi:unnamed protein product [Staurois parvus]|uniref:Uncharacterized protein n=1 Tax=Staurois parvus TaxID=386267 RepID=A0ABN9EAI5_9NEOB|nr:unnamed protein product [Staurois parvus]
MYTHTYMYIHADTCTDIQYTCTYTQTRTHTHKKLQYFVVHSQSRVLGGREHSTHSFLCYHCAQLLSSLTAPSANDRSGLSSKPAQQDGTGGHTRPHPNFHLPLVSRRV